MFEKTKKKTVKDLEPKEPIELDKPKEAQEIDTENKFLKTPYGKSWNKIIEALLVVEAEWPTFAGHCKAKEIVEDVTPIQQRALAISTNKNKFSIGLPPLCEFWKRSGGLELLLIKKGGN